MKKDLDSFLYEVQPDGGIWLTKYITKYKTEVTIPLMINGKSVSRIGKRCFYNCKNLVSVTIPEGVNSIGSFAFDGCVSLERINIPNSINDIGRHAFGCCEKLSSMILPGTIKEIRSHTFYRCRSLKEFIVPEGCEKIGYKAFIGSGIERVVIAKTVKEIGNYAFYLHDLRVALPCSLENIVEEKAKRHWFGSSGSCEPIDWIEEMDYPIARNLFMGKTPFNKNGTLLMFYDEQYQVVKQVTVK